MQVSTNLVKALSHCSADEQAALAALLDTLQLTKLLRLLPFPTAERIASLIKESKDKFLNLHPEQRQRFLFTEIVRRTKASAYNSEEEISLLLLQKAAQKYGVDVAQPPLSLARELLHHGLLSLLKGYLDSYEKADEIRRREMYKQVEEALRTSPSQVVEELRKMSGVEKITADTLIAVMKRIVEGGGAMIFINSLGFSVYIALSTFIHTVFTTLLGITLPFGVYTTASTVLSVLTGPVGWGLLGTMAVLMFGYQGNRLNLELLNMVTLSALLRWYQEIHEQQEMAQERAILLLSQDDPLPLPVKERVTLFAQVRQTLQQAEKQLVDVQTQIQKAHQRKDKQQQQYMLAVKRRDSLQAQTQNLESELQRATNSRNDIRKKLERVVQENSTLHLQLSFAESEVHRLKEELLASMQLMEEAENRRLRAEKELEEVAAWAEKQIQQLQEQKTQAEQTISMLREQLHNIRTRRKEDYHHRFQRLMAYVQLDEKALEWFAEQTDENLLLAAERVILDLNYSVYPPNWGKSITGTCFREIHFAKDYRLYFYLRGTSKIVALIGHKSEQKQHIHWLQQQRIH
ncbi:MAG: hypothetical protein NZ749_04735 [bacterium]|nr:hypothetical protein [bacterium]